MVVVDEADFFFESSEDREQMNKFYGQLGDHVQKIFFSATYADEVSKFIKTVVPTKTIKIEIQKAKLNLEGIKQIMYLAKNEEGQDARHNPKINILSQILTSLGSADKIIIFFNSKKYL